MESSLASALIWLSTVLTGPVAISLGILAVASLGIATLGGRIDFRKAVQILIGLFVLFAAPSIGLGLHGLVGGVEATPLPSNADSQQVRPHSICWTCG
jgi:type IV secretory pathway VirB2 component (pilin)